MAKARKDKVKKFAWPTAHAQMPARTSLQVMRLCGPLFRKSCIQRFGIAWPEIAPKSTNQGLWVFASGRSVLHDDIRGQPRSMHDLPVYVGAENAYMWLSVLGAYIRKKRSINARAYNRTRVPTRHDNRVDTKRSTSARV